MATLRQIQTSYLVGFAASALLIMLPFQNVIELDCDIFEVIGVIAGSWSLWLLAKNLPLGWWIDLLNVTIYIGICINVRLYGEVGIQMFYLVTEIQAIYIWMRGSHSDKEQSISHLPVKYFVITIPLILMGTVLLYILLTALEGASPLLNGIAVVLCITAQVYLICRFCESWYLLVTAYVIYIPLYASQGLYLTSLSYVGFLLLALNGLCAFQRECKEQQVAHQPQLVLCGL